MRVKRIEVSQIFSPWCGGRYRTDGAHSGEAFRDDILKPVLFDETYDIVIVDFRQCYGAPLSFLYEIFVGLTEDDRFNYELLEKLRIYTFDNSEVFDIMVTMSECLGAR